MEAHQARWMSEGGVASQLHAHTGSVSSLCNIAHAIAASSTSSTGHEGELLMGGYTNATDATRVVLDRSINWQ